LVRQRDLDVHVTANGDGGFVNGLAMDRSAVKPAVINSEAASYIGQDLVLISVLAPDVVER
jgi:hypothetical protein